jgi:hypothetical protein
MGTLLTILQTLKHEVYDYWQLKRIKNCLCAQKQITIGDKVHVYYITILWQVYNESVLSMVILPKHESFLVMNNFEFRFISQT